MSFTKEDSERFFCIGTSEPDADTDDDGRPVAPISTAGMIRACVTHDDGTSHLLLLGTSGAALLLAIIAVGFLRNQIKPINELARAASAFGRGRTVPLSDYRRSIAIAMPCPPPMHMVIKAFDPPMRSSSYSALTVIIQPVAPTG